MYQVYSYILKFRLGFMGVLVMTFGNIFGLNVFTLTGTTICGNIGFITISVKGVFHIRGL